YPVAQYGGAGGLERSDRTRPARAPFGGTRRLQPLLDGRYGSRRTVPGRTIPCVAAVERRRHLPGHQSLEFVLFSVDLRSRRPSAGRNLCARLRGRAGAAAATRPQQADRGRCQRAILAFSGCSLDLFDGLILLLGVMSECPT